MLEFLGTDHLLVSLTQTGVILLVILLCYLLTVAFVFFLLYVEFLTINDFDHYLTGHFQELLQLRLGQIHELLIIVGADNRKDISPVFQKHSVTISFRVLLFS